MSSAVETFSGPSISPLPGRPAPKELLVDVARLEREYFARRPDVHDPNQRVIFGTSGHRGSPLHGTFTEAHILAITQAIRDYRRAHGIDGPLYMGKDTHAVSEPAQRTALDVLAANNVDTVIQPSDGATPTPVISRAILVYNRDHKAHFADGIVTTPSHNPPEDGGFKYDPPHGGPADTDMTQWVEDRANDLLREGNAGVKRVPFATAIKAATAHQEDFALPYIRDLRNVIDMDAIRAAGLKLGVDPLGGATRYYWEPINSIYQLDIAIVDPAIDPTFAFMTADHDGVIRIDSSSPYAMARLVGLKDKYRLAFATDPDTDRHGIVTPSAGLMNPNQYLAVAIRYLLLQRALWPAHAAVGKTLASSMIDRLVQRLGHGLWEVPVGFKWFVPGLFDGSCCFGGEESAGASFLRRDGAVWTTDKDGVIMSLLAAEVTAKTGNDPGEHYRELTAEFGTPYYARMDSPATPEQKASLRELSPEAIRESSLAGELILAKLTRAPGNNAPIGGLKVVGRKWLVCGSAFRHRGHLQDLCGKLPGPVTFERYPDRGRGNCEQRTEWIERTSMSRHRFSVPPFPAGYRASRLLLHVTSLPSPYGIGDMGPAALAWIDRLAKAGQTWWQSLPLGPTGSGNSPYDPLSSFAGNSLLISPDWLIEDGLVRASNCQIQSSPQGEIDYNSVIPFKHRLLETAWANFKVGERPDLRADYERFRNEQGHWLEDYALFRALKVKFDDAYYLEWPAESVQREASALERARGELAGEIGQVCFGQFLVFRQSERLKAYAHLKGGGLIDDIPFYVSPDSSDVWADPELFLLDEHRRPRFVAGVPPDYFSAQGQLWGNPVYNWDAIHQSGYGWCIARLRSLLAHVDVIRLDHFQGFVAAWHVPAGATTAQSGKWAPGPGAEFFGAAEKSLGALPFLAEDLGMITTDVYALRDQFHLPGMRVLQFAFDGHPDNPHLPHNYAANTVAYTGTHDNPTTREWFEDLPDGQRQNFWKYLKRSPGESGEVAPAMMDLAWSSAAALAMAPLQDLLNLGREARMNVPGRVEGNWRWRMSEDMLSSPAFEALHKLTKRSNRLVEIGAAHAGNVLEAAAQNALGNSPSC